MKRYFAFLLALVMVLALAACGKTETDPTTPTTAPSEPTTPTTAPSEPVDEGVMTYAEYMAAPMDSEVTVVTYVQGHQSWWNDKITVYCQSPDGAYFLYEMHCSEENAAKLVPGTKIRVTGYKSEWAGEVEIVDANFEILEGEPYIATATDVTALLGTDELIDHQNEVISIKGATVVSVSYKNGTPGDDIYVTVTVGGANYDLCVEFYLTGTDTEVYKAVGELKAGDVVDIEGFLYWYNGINAHITDVKVVAPYAKGEGVMTHEEYVNAAMESEVVIEAYVQDHQSWWSNKITVYAQDPDGAYFLYEMHCSEENAAKLVPGTKIRVTGYKSEWSGEVEIVDANFEILEEGTYIAPAKDLTALLGSEDMLKHQNEKAAFSGMTVAKVEYKNGTPGDDIYVTLEKDGAKYGFCVEFYLTGTETEVYKTVGTLNTGDVVDVTCFLYWYNGMNPHLTSVVKK